MKRYYYDVTNVECVPKGYRKRGYNKLIRVYKMRRDGHFTFIADEWINTASYRGDYSTAAHILHRIMGHKLGASGYGLLRQDITIIQLP